MEQRHVIRQGQCPSLIALSSQTTDRAESGHPPFTPIPLVSLIAALMKPRSSHPTIVLP